MTVQAKANCSVWSSSNFATVRCYCAVFSEIPFLVAGAAFQNRDEPMHMHTTYNIMENFSEGDSWSLL